MSDLRAELRKLTVLSGSNKLRVFESRMFDEPTDLFIEWLRTSIDEQVPEPHVVVLSTVDSNNTPNSRALILKNIDKRGWYFAISNNSPKGQDIAQNQQVALTFYWQPLARQVRIRGAAMPLDKSTNSQDFLSRSKSARALALAGMQSKVMENEGDLEAQLQANLNKIESTPDLTSDAWSVYCVEASSVEFWQGAASRNHERLLFRKENGSFVREKLWP